jgi:pimeloyl-ACP methyl ester carboxylesterase
LQLAQSGFRSVALDVTGHGDSPEKRTRWAYFLRDIEAITQSLGEEVYAYVAHSAGALSTMAARHLKGIRAKHYVCICAPSHPFPPITAVKKKLNPGERVIEGYKRYIANQFENSWEKLEDGASFKDVDANMLLFYDKRDRFVPHTEGDRIKSLCPKA